MNQEQNDSSQQPFNAKVTELLIEDAFILTYSYKPILFVTSKLLKVTLILTPKQTMPNLSIEVNMKGHSFLQMINNEQVPTQNLEITEAGLYQDDEKTQGNAMLKKSIQTNKHNKQKITFSEQQSGEYFLQGCKVLFQLDDISHQRLQTLIAGTEYIYPIEFILPSNLPASLSRQLLSHVHITIAYSLQIKVYFSRDRSHTVSVPFEMVQKPKLYPFQELVVNQKIRCYSQNGKRRDKSIVHKISKLVRCICPLMVSESFRRKYNFYSSNFQGYDIYYVELLAVVSKDDSLFLTVRAYKEPDQQQLSISREKKTKSASIKPSITKVAKSEIQPDLSLISIKQTQRKPTDITITKVQVQMFGEIVHLCKQVIFIKTIPMTYSNYDMLQGEAIVQLKDHLSYPYSCHNELFVLQYSFSIKAFFEEEASPLSVPFDLFVVDQITKQLKL